MMSLLRFTLYLLALPLVLLVAACSSGDSATPTPEERIRPGVEGPDFTLPASDGSTVSLADYQGRPVLLYFHMAMG
jgi:cytochrome oxidase Cu insertion factor (SCO1/SenC/PrrC family)